MPVSFTNLLNKTVYLRQVTTADNPPSSVSVRLEKLQPEQYVELYGVSWGVPLSSEAALTALDYALLWILRNEVFNDNQIYGDVTAGTTTGIPFNKDVIYFDVATNQERWREIEFNTPLRLDDAANYLIVVPAATDIASAASAYDLALTVRGAIKPRPKDEQRLGHWNVR